MRVFPLGLPDRRVLSTPGEFHIRGGRLSLTQVVAGRGLLLPLVFDWHPSRRSAEPAWRTLTVTEDRVVQRSDRAQAHRLKVHNLHLLIYRALVRGQEPRAVLGLHTRHESVMARIEPDGEIATIVQVE